MSILPLALLAVAAFASPRPAAADEPLIFPPDQPADCLHIRLELKVDIPKKHVDAQATIDVQAARELRSIRLDAVDFAVSKVALARDSQEPVEAKYVNDGESITVTCDPPLPRGTRASVQIAYTLDAPERGLHFFAPSEDEPDVPAIVWSQGEATENRYWFPCFDHPAEMQTTELIVTAAAGNEVVSNGTLLSKSADSRTGDVVFHWKQDKPHVAYLVTLVIGPFHVETETWRGKPIRYYANPKYKDWIKRSFANTVPMLEFFSQRIGVEYPWDQYAQVAAYGFGGGMENTSATTMGEWVLHDERSILDGNSDGLIAHEMAHQWFGDLLTCKDWAHIWLNEGFASYFDPLWIEHNKGRDEFLRDMYGNARSALRSGKDKPIVNRRYGNPDSQFDGRAYGKGAWVLHMLRCQVGDETFFRAINRYVTSHRHQCVETADLRRAFEIETGRNFERFFYDWTERPGHPVITVDYEWIEDDKTARVVVKQTQKEEAFHFPLELELRTEGGDPVSVHRDVREKEETILVPLAAAPTLVRFDPRYTLLCELTQNKGRDLWAAQLTQDDNPVARLQAAQYFAKRKSERDGAMLAEALAKEKFWGVQVEIVDALREIGGRAACEALVEGLTADHPRVRRACADALDEFKSDETAVAAALRAIVEKGDPSYDVEAAAIASYAGLRPEDGFDLLKGLLGRESRFEVIRSAVLEGLGRLRDPRAIDLLVEWTKGDKSRHCRPDAIAALAEIVANTTCDETAVSRVVAALSACVDNQSRQIRRAAVSGLGSLGGAARSALPALESLQATETSRRGAREAIENAIKRIRENQPASVEVGDLRKEVEKLRKENEDLKKRLKRLEAARAGDGE